MKIIYRKSDHIIAAYLTTKGASEEDEFNNIYNSELGGSREDYEVVDADPIDESQYRYIINDDKSVGQELLPEVASKVRLAELKEKGKASWSEEDRDEILDLLIRS